MSTKTEPAKQSEAIVHEGMGALVHPEGVAFRLWAPNAQAVWVVGDFNKWAPDSNPCQAEEGGNWYTDVPEARPGQEYKFRLLTAAGDELMRNDPYAREMTNSAGNGIIHDPAFDWGEDSFTLSSANELVIYELHIGTFNEGTFQSAIKRLDHLVRLGVNAIEVMPAAEFAGEISWGYNPAQIFAVESTYGGSKGLKEFVKQAHQRGLGIIMDVVYNHFGPSDLDLWRFDGWYEGEGGGIYFYNDWRAETPWGATRPDYGRPEVRRFIRDNAMMWLEEYRIDGLRFDATLYIRRVRLDEDPTADLPEGWDMVQALNGEVRGRFPTKILIAEDNQDHAALTASIEAGGGGFHCQWDARFVHPVRAALIAPTDEARSMADLAAALQASFNGDPFQSVIYTESHDEVANGKQRIPSEIKADEPDAWFARKRSILGGVLVMTTPAIPMIFQGQEFLASGWFQDTEPLDWHLREDYRGVLLLYRDLIRLRRNLLGTTAGLSGAHVAMFRVDDPANVLAFHRWKEGGPRDSVVVIANFANEAKPNFRLGFPAPGRWSLRFNSDSSRYGDDFATLPVEAVETDPMEWDGQPQSAEVNIPPYSALIFSQEP